MTRFRWIVELLRLNWANMTAHKGAFWSLAALMCVQNFIYFSTWAVVFNRITDMNGWGLRDVAFLFGSGAMGYGIIFTIFGGLNQLGQIIHDGELDSYLARPRSVLWLVLMSRMRADSLGDCFTGLVMLAFFVRPPFIQLPLLFILSLSAGVVFGSVRLMANSLSFWGLGGDTGENGFMAFLIAATNPQKGFGRGGKIILLTIFPAGYVGLLPVEILHQFRWDYMALQIAGSVTILMIALWIFEQGLRRYTSGNMFTLLR